MSKREKIKRIKKSVENALLKYDVENVDIIKNEENETIDIMYHSRHNSFPITDNVCSSDRLRETDISDIADCYDIGYCW